MLRGYGTTFGNDLGSMSKGRIIDLEIINQVNGFWINKYEKVWIERVNMVSFVGNLSNSTAIKIGQPGSGNNGSDLHINDTSIYSIPTSAAGSTPKLNYGVWIEDTDAVFMSDSEVGGALKSNLVIKGSSMANHWPQNHFFSNVIFDATVNEASVHITGEGRADRLYFTGCWIASAGRMQQSEGTLKPDGMLIDINDLGGMGITGGTVYNASGSGIHIYSSLGSAPIAISGVQILNNGNDGITVNVPVNALGPVITGVDEMNSGRYGLQTSNANRMVVTGNRFVSGYHFNQHQPQVFANNGY